MGPTPSTILNRPRPMPFLWGPGSLKAYKCTCTHVDWSSPPRHPDCVYRYDVPSRHVYSLPEVPPFRYNESDPTRSCHHLLHIRHQTPGTRISSLAAGKSIWIYEEISLYKYSGPCDYSKLFKAFHYFKTANLWHQFYIHKINIPSFYDHL